MWLTDRFDNWFNGYDDYNYLGKYSTGYILVDIASYLLILGTGIYLLYSRYFGVESDAISKDSRKNTDLKERLKDIKINLQIMDLFNNIFLYGEKLLENGNEPEPLGFYWNEQGILCRSEPDKDSKRGMRLMKIQSEIRSCNDELKRTNHKGGFLFKLLENECKLIYDGGDDDALQLKSAIAQLVWVKNICSILIRDKRKKDIFRPILERLNGMQVVFEKQITELISSRNDDSIPDDDDLRREWSLYFESPDHRINNIIKLKYQYVYLLKRLIDWCQLRIEHHNTMQISGGANPFPVFHWIDGILREGRDPKAETGHSAIDNILKKREEDTS